jgi:hypothetical protein
MKHDHGVLQKGIPQPAHLVGKNSGTPLCRIGLTLERFGVTCGHTSLASARRAQKILKDGGFFARVVRGHCPESFEGKEN